MVVGMDEIEKRLGHELFGRVAHGFFPHGVEPLEMAVETRDGQQIEGNGEEKITFFLGALPLDELDDLTADRGAHFEKLRFGFADLLTEELEGAEDLVAGADRPADAAVQVLLDRE